MNAATLVLYSCSCLFELGVLLFLFIVERKIQPTFWKIAFISTMCIFFGFSLSLIGFVTTNENFDCAINRKVSYSIRYIGFLLFDYAQARKFIRVYATSSKFKSYLIYGAFVVRILSYIYNAVMVSGAVAFHSDNVVGKGPCQTVFQPFDIYQEHGISVFYELVLVSILAMYASQQSVKDSFEFSNFLKKIMDFEMYCFAFYFFFEVVYLIVYSFSPKNLVSVFNIFYLQIPVVLFFANTVNVIERKWESKDMLSGNDVSRAVSTNRPSNKDTPAIFSTKDYPDVPTAFGRKETVKHVVAKETVKKQS
ncbi:hypothetical protein HDV01_005042 [Terramyces sp. JEL0728]|nr:hypothetical protein HDV01_005042 [Terramyces sp. JEL0728]